MLRAGYQHAFFEQCEEDFGVTLTAQGEGDLGARMLCALERAFETSQSAAGRCRRARAGKEEWTAAEAALGLMHDIVLIPPTTAAMC